MAGAQLSVERLLSRPVWLSSGSLRHYQYRDGWPARAVGGLVRPSLTLAIDGQPARTVPLDWLDTVTPAIEAARQIVIGGLGTPTIVVPPAARADAPDPSRDDISNLFRLLIPLARSGVPIWLDLDDYPFSDGMPSPASIRALAAFAGRDEAMDETDIRPPAEACAQSDADMRAILAGMSGVIASTPTLVDAIRPFTLRVLVGPNVIDPDAVAAAARPEDGRVRIGVVGNWTHAADLRLVLPALERAAGWRGVAVAFVGVHPLLAESQAPGVYRFGALQYRYLGHLSFPDYLRVLGSFDIALIPLLSTRFNRCRAPSKWMEYALHEIPVILSDLPPYDCVTHGVTGLKVRHPGDWERHLRALVHDADLRRTIGAAARRAVLAEHSVAAQAETWRAVIHAAAGDA